MKKFTYISAIAVTTCAPLLAFAQTIRNDGSVGDLSSLITKITGYLNSALVLMMGLAVVTFVWNVFQYYIKPNDERAQANSYVMWSIIGFFVILSMWGLVNILSGTFRFKNNQAPTPDSLNSLFPH